MSDEYKADYEIVEHAPRLTDGRATIDASARLQTGDVAQRDLLTSVSLSAYRGRVTPDQYRVMLDRLLTATDAAARTLPRGFTVRLEISNDE